MYCGRDQPRIQTEVPGHLLVCSLVCTHCSLVRSLAHFADSLARGTVIDSTAIYSVFFSILAHSAPTPLIPPSFPLTFPVPGFRSVSISALSSFSWFFSLPLFLGAVFRSVSFKLGCSEHPTFSIERFFFEFYIRHLVSDGYHLKRST